ncbi:hypothetical protein KDA_71530 [Dictyobacter alpinus]|uniref:RDD domain-containing protein n=1 Tax=Dictyobacter alpinus TaxID=2014873 RepID=A0A402BJZ4_9CHLR|nr:RDD family protein [Dictyobacter alpinus]GCE31669.1 hypothetical protein KDA_71530 [Dictyobacter alpinus]
MLTGHANLNSSIDVNSSLNVSVVEQRLLAALLDLLCLAGLGFLVNTTFGVVHVTSGMPLLLAQNGWSIYTATTTVDWWWLALLTFSYFFVLETLFSTTIGKAMLGLYVIPASAERRSWHITPWQAFLRNLLRPLEALQIFYVLGTGLLTLIIISRTEKHQRLGDLLARTIVVDKKSLPNPPYPASQRHRRTVILVAILTCCVAGCTVFYYYGRPPLVIEGLYNTRQLLNNSVQSYQLGSPSWGTDKAARSIITYPIHVKSIQKGKMQTCDGKLMLHWDNFPQGWTSDGGAFWNCTP